MLNRILTDNRFLLFFVPLQLGISLWLFHMLELPYDLFHFAPIAEFMTLFILFLGFIAFFPRLFAKHTLMDMRDGSELTNVVLSIFLISVSLCLYGTVKSVISAIDPFSWDPFFVDLERSLHFGVTPQAWIRGLYQWPVVIQVIEFLYVSWLPLLYAYLCWWLLHKPGSPGRAELIITFVLVWFLFGNIMAILFSSAGPIFFNLVHPSLPDPYVTDRDLFYAASGHSLTIELQAVLADILSHHGDRIQVTGISAFPSIHMGVAILLATHAWFYDRPAFIWLGLAVAGLMLACVLLLWHYAVDGYAMLVLVPALFWLVRWVVGVTRGPRETSIN